MSSSTHEQPSWMRELIRLARHKSLIFLHGNIGDTLFYPLPPEPPVEPQQSGEAAAGTDAGAQAAAAAPAAAQEAASPVNAADADAQPLPWTAGDMRSALFDVCRRHLKGYEIIGSYSFVDGMRFSDASAKEPKMAQRFADVIKANQQQQRSPVPAALPSTDPLDHALHSLRACLLNTNVPSILIVEHASQLCTNPGQLQQPERLSFLRLLLASQQSPAVALKTDSGVQQGSNLLILLCGKLTDLPAWLYLNNPFSGAVEVRPPRMSERKLFFATQCGDLSAHWDEGDLADLTEGMSYRDLCGIRTLALDYETEDLKPKALIDHFKYGRRDSEWDALEYDKLADAEGILARRVIGQPQACSAVADVLRRAKLGLSGAQHSSRSKPRGVLFFAGPTGVGKTELAKAIAELVFGSEEALLRFDMSEYSQAHADQRLLGAPPGYVGYEEGGQLTQHLVSNPFRVLLFDEIEKAHSSILDKFLQILEDGRLTDGKGQTVYFSESIVVFTSNAGIYRINPETGRPMVDPATGRAQLNVDPKEVTKYEEVRDRLKSGVEDYFKSFLNRPELLNRIGQNIIVFDFVRQEVMRKILENKVLPSISSQILQLHKINVSFSTLVSDRLLELIGDDVSQGGRGVGNRVEQALINPLSRELYTHLARGEELEGRGLIVNDVIFPAPGGDGRYEIASELH